jgi:hypothetical protein
MKRETTLADAITYTPSKRIKLAKKEKKGIEIQREPKAICIRR